MSISLHGSIYRTAAGAALVMDRYQELLDQWPVPAESLRIPTREGETFVVASGPVDAPQLLALQGSGANAAMWLPQIATLSENRRVYAIDVIGEPGLSAPSRPRLESDAYARWLDDVLAGLGLQEAAFVGRSLGGWFAADYAVRRPGRVTALIMLSPSGIGRQKLRPLAKLVILSLFGERGLRATFKTSLGPIPPGPIKPPAWAAAFAEFPILIFKAFRPRMGRIPIFSDDDLRQLKMPVLVIVGGRDPMLESVQTEERLSRLVPSADVRLLPAAGHLLPDTAESIVTFLNGAAIGRLHG